MKDVKDEGSRTCTECQGRMSPIIVMDKLHTGPTKQLHMGPTTHRNTGSLEYRLPDDRLSFWTGKYPTAGPVAAFMCEGCGRIALYGGKPDA